MPDVVHELSEEETASDDDDDDDYDMSSTYTRSSYFSEYTTDTADFHSHPVRGSKCNGETTSMGYLAAIMNYCRMGDAEMAHSDSTTPVTPQSDPSWDNVKELKRVISVLSPSHAKLVPRVNAHSHHDAATKTLIINLSQVEFLKQFPPVLKSILHKRRVPLLLLNDPTGSLYLRYGVFDLKLGKGSYGLIRLVRPCPASSANGNGVATTKKHRRKLYVVKEFIPRKDIPIDNFVDKIVSEFIIGKSMNYKHVNKCIDLMVCLDNFKVMLVMDCTKGGDLFSYIKSFKQDALGADSDDILTLAQSNCLTLAQVCCFVKQVAKGLLYMHDFGIAHCDIKLENILLDYVNPDEEDVCNPGFHGSNQGNIILKLSDFGKSSVVRTCVDAEEQLYSGPPQGSEHFMAPEEFKVGASYKLTKKDCWAFGVLVALFFRILKKVKTGSLGTEAYLWMTTEGKGKSGKYRDRRFQKYMETTQVASYDDETKEWLVQRQGAFKPIENLFDYSTSMLVDDSTEDDDDDDDDKSKKNGSRNSSRKNSHVAEEDQGALLRKLIIYKLLDPNPDKRMNMEEFLDTDWMVDVECCV